MMRVILGIVIGFSLAEFVGYWAFPHHTQVHSDLHMAISAIALAIACATLAHIWEFGK